jgi:Tfp pilus assembly protein PilF
MFSSVMLSAASNRRPHVLLCLALAIGCSSPPPPAAPATDPSAVLGPDEGEESAGFSAGVEAISAGEFDKARGVFEKIAAEQPSNAKAHFYLGVARQNLEQREAAIESYEKALSLDPKLTEAAVNLTAALLDAGDAARAEPVIERALASDPQNPGLLYNRALVASTIGKKTEAVAYYREALAAEPNNAEIKYGYAEALVAAGSTTEARTVLTELIQADDVPVLASSARLLGRLDDFSGCIQALTRAVERQPSAELFVARGLCQHGKRDEQAALADFQRAIAKDASYAPAHYYAGMHLKSQGKKKEARAALSRAVELAGDEGVGQAAKRALVGL